MIYSVLQQVSDALTSNSVLYSREREIHRAGVRGTCEMGLRVASAEVSWSSI